MKAAMKDAMKRMIGLRKKGYSIEMEYGNYGSAEAYTRVYAYHPEKSMVRFGVSGSIYLFTNLIEKLEGKITYNHPTMGFTKDFKPEPPAPKYWIVFRPKNMCDRRPAIGPIYNDYNGMVEGYEPHPFREKEVAQGYATHNDGYGLFPTWDEARDAGAFAWHGNEYNKVWDWNPRMNVL